LNPTPDRIVEPSLTSPSPPTEAPPRNDSVIRSAIKAVTYRIIGTASTAGVAYFVTGDAGSALAIGGLEFVTKFFIYYAHERAWARIPVGTVRLWFRKPKPGKPGGKP
jgi:uncharacterized membrane protein